MWSFFNKPQNLVSSDSEIPNLDYLHDSVLLCPKCKAENDISNCEPLQVMQCAGCNNQLFIPLRLEDYWLYKPLGGGGMGCVYKATSYAHPNEIFSIKILPRNKKENHSLIDTLLREASIGQSFGNHPNLMRVLNYGEYRGEYYVVMNFVKGQRLDQLIESGDPIEHKYILLWALQILAAEQRIYELGYLYRDLKPENIIINDAGSAVLIDYGLCKLVTEAMEENKTDVIEGSPVYMPPERIIGAAEGMHSELYSLGMVLFHALARKTYYSESGAYATAKKHITSQSRYKHIEAKLSSSVDPKICEVVNKMIAKFPVDRYHTYNDCVKAVKEVLNYIL